MLHDRAARAALLRRVGVFAFANLFGMRIRDSSHSIFKSGVGKLT